MDSTKQNLEDLLRAMGKTQKGKKWQCPNHDDQNPSATIVGEGNDCRVFCFVCGKPGWDKYDLRDMCESKPNGTAFKKEKQGSSQSVTTPVKKQRIYSLKELENGGTVYKYGGSRINLIVVRSEQGGGKKTFCQFTPQGVGYVAIGTEGLLPLYNQGRIASGNTVVIVEGEKCVHALHDVGIVATTKPCGAQAPEKADWTPLYGKEVILWPDNDEVGIKYMKEVRELLMPHCKVKWIDPTRYALEDKGDAYDWIEKCKANNMMGSVKLPLEEAVSCGASAGLFKHLDDVASGRIKNISLGWPVVSGLTQAFIPGTITFLVGQGGDGKSLMTTQIMQYLHSNEVSWSMLELEDNRNFHLTRILAQRVKNSSITQFDEMLGKEDYVAELQAEHREWADEFGSRIWVRPKGGISLVDESPLTKDTINKGTVVSWIMTRAKAGDRIIMVDPITATRTSGNKWEQDQKFVEDAKEIASDYGCSIELVTHPATEFTTPSLYGIRGGKMMGNLCHTALWLKSIPQKDMQRISGSSDWGMMVEIETDCGALLKPINRELILIKTRSGTGQGWRIGYWFDKKSLTFKELGVIKS